MTLRHNRADRIHARRLGALKRLQVGLSMGERFHDTLGICPHDDESRARANAEADVLALRTAKPPTIQITAKYEATGSEARKLHRRGKLAR